MAKRSYRGPSGKQFWENAQFSKGILHTDETLKAGFVRMMSNFDISRSGGSLETRGPLFSVLFKKPEDESPGGLKKNTLTFRPQQDQDNVYYLNIGNSEKERESQYLFEDWFSPDDLRVIDGDTVEYLPEGERIRLLAIDTPEMDTHYGEKAGWLLVELLRRASSVRLHQDKGSTSFKDYYGRHIAFLYVEIGNERSSDDFGFDGDPYFDDFEDLVDDEAFEEEDTVNTSVKLVELGYARLMHEKDYEYGSTYHVPKFEYYLPDEQDASTDPLVEARDSVEDSGIWGDELYMPDDREMVMDSSSDSVSTPQGDFETPAHDNFHIPRYLSDNPDDRLVFEFIKGGSDLEGNVSDFKVSDEPTSERTASISTSSLEIDGKQVTIKVKDLVDKVEDELDDFDWTSRDLSVSLTFDIEIDSDDDIMIYYWSYDTDNNLTFDSHSTFTDPNVSLYRHPVDYVLRQHRDEDDNITTPYIELEEYTGSLNFSTIYSDLDIDYSLPIRIEIVSREYTKDYNNLYDYHKEDYGIAHIPNLDGFAFMGRVEDLENEETLFEGLMTIKYSVPMDDNKPNLKRFSFEVETYHSENLFQVPFNQMGVGFSFNLLDSKAFDPRSYIGEEALDEGYPVVTGLAAFTYDDDDQLIERMLYNRDYKIKGHFAIPGLYDDSYDGYAVRWEVTDPDGRKREDWKPIYENEPDTDGDVQKITFSSETEEHKVNFNSDNEYSGIGDLDDEDESKIEEAYNREKDKDDDDFKDILNEDDVIVIQNPDTGVLERPTNDSLFNEVSTREQVNILMARFKYRYEYDTSAYRELGSYEGVTYYYFNLVPDPDESSVTIASTTLDYTGYEERRFIADQHHMDPHSCRKISYFKGFTLLYDSPKHPETIFVSEEQNISYFPFRFALDQFEEPIVHVHPHKDGFLVFTNTNIFMVSLEYPEMEDSESEPEPIFQATLIMTNTSIKKRHSHLVKSFGRDILMYTDNSFYLIKPNQFVTDETNMYLQEISTPIQNIFDNPTKFITRRLQYYGVAGNIFSQDWKPELEHYVVIKNKEIWVYSSAYLEPVEKTFMFISIYNHDTKLWKVYDTMAMSFPYMSNIFESDQGWQVLVKNHPSIDQGVTLMLDEGFDVYEFHETDVEAGGVFDIKPLKLENGSFVYNSSTDFDEVKHPINLFYDSGYLDISPHINKRFHKTTLEFTNINAPTVDLAAEFNLDGRIRQTSNKVRMEHITDSSSDDYGVIKEKYEFEPFVRKSNEAVDGSITFDEWQLGIQKFGPLNKLRVTLPISGRGKIPGFEFGIRTNGKLALFRHQVIFKEQSYR